MNRWVDALQRVDDEELMMMNRAGEGGRGGAGGGLGSSLVCSCRQTLAYE